MPVQGTKPKSTGRARAEAASFHARVWVFVARHRSASIIPPFICS
jgi:hypothetical protein